MNDRKQYILQPYRVGPKDRKSLVITIPAALSKKYKIDFDSTVVLRPLDNTIQFCIIEEHSGTKVKNQFEGQENGLQQIDANYCLKGEFS